MGVEGEGQQSPSVCGKCGGRFHTFVGGQWRPCACYWRVRAQVLMARAGIPYGFRAVKLSAFVTGEKTGNVKAVKLVRSLAAGFMDGEMPSKSFVLFGEHNTGKTMLASIIIRYALAAGHSAALVDAERVLSIRFDLDQDYGRIEDLMAPDVLCLELGGEYQTKMTPWLVTYILGQRRLQQRFTFVTSSVAPNELRERYGDEARAMLLSDRFTRLTLQGVEE